MNGNNRYSRLGYEIIRELRRSDEAMTRTVETDSLTDMANECFDLPFDGTCKFYPFEMPELPPYKILAVTGRSGSGKSTILRSVRKSVMSKPLSQDDYVLLKFLEKGIPSEEFCYRIEKVGLDKYDIATKRFGQLSEGEKFRVEVALNIGSNTIFDEFTSMVDRNIAKTVSEGLREIVDRECFENVTLCSCHKDFIGWVNPDLIIDLDDYAVYSKTDSEQVDTGKEHVSELIGTINVLVSKWKK
jgi:ABC-type transport system involved in cytochrome bd biosynthesis fused ATPase/permease subunit